MKKKICMLAVMVLAGCLWMPCSVRADVIWEPFDPFYEEHREECERMGRSFTANGPDGKVIVYKSPQLPEEVETWENGKQVYIHFTYEDRRGVVWGVYDDYNGTVGWMPMDYMELVYDSISFQEEYAEEILPQDGTLDDVREGEEIYMWKYPGSEVYTPMSIEDTEDALLRYNGIYVDENGNRWAHIGYYFGIRDVWVCMDAPDADLEKLRQDGILPKESQTQKDEELQTGEDASEESQAGEDASEKASKEKPRIVPKPDSGAMTLTIALVTAVTAATAGLLLFLKKGRKRNKNK